MTTTRGRHVLRLLAIVLGITLIAAACSDDSSSDSSSDADVGETDETDEAEPETDDSESEPDTTEAEPEPDTTEADAEPTASFRGVTEDSITVGIAMLDFAFLVDNGLSEAGWGDQQAVWEALIADLNANGGVLGREIIPIYEFYSPIDPQDADRVCTTLTQDNEVFAVLGGFVGPAAGTVDPCITGLNETVLVGGDQNADELAQSVAPWYQPGQSNEASTEILLNLLEETGGLEGQEVFVMGGQDDSANQEAVITALEDRGITVVGSDLILAEDGDVTGQDAESQLITERIQTDGATAVFIHGNPSASIRGLAAAGLIDSLDIWSNNPSGLNNLGATMPDKSVANGVVTAAGPDDTTIWDDPLFQSQCVDVVAAALPDADLRPPAEYAEDEENWFNSIRRYCQHLDLFVQIANAAGVELTPESFVAGAESLADFSLPGSASASLSDTKLFAEDTFALAEYDSTAGDGMAVPVGEYVDVYN